MKTALFPRVAIRVRATVEVSGIERWGCERTKDIEPTMDEALGISHLLHWGMTAAVEAVSEVALIAVKAVRQLEVSGE